MLSRVCVLLNRVYVLLSRVCVLLNRVCVMLSRVCVMLNRVCVMLSRVCVLLNRVCVMLSSSQSHSEFAKQILPPETLNLILKKNRKKKFRYDATRWCSPSLLLAPKQTVRDCSDRESLVVCVILIESEINSCAFCVRCQKTLALYDFQLAGTRQSAYHFRQAILRHI